MQGVRPLIQHLERLKNGGYEYFVVVKVPANDEAKKEQLIEKLKRKFGLPLSKDQYYRLKLKGVARYVVLSYRGVAILCRTAGINHPNDNEIWQKKIDFFVSETTQISISSNGVRIGGETIKRLHAKLKYYSQGNDPKSVYLALLKHRGLVCTKTTFRQYLNAVEVALKLAKKHGFKLLPPKVPKAKYEKVF